MQSDPRTTIAALTMAFMLCQAGLVLFGNGLMNDARLGQTVDPAKTGQTSLIYFRWLRENKNALGCPHHELDPLTSSMSATMKAAISNTLLRFRVWS